MLKPLRLGQDEREGRRKRQGYDDIIDFYFIIFAIEVYKAEIIILGVIVIKKKKEFNNNLII